MLNRVFKFKTIIRSTKTCLTWLVVFLLPGASSAFGLPLGDYYKVSARNLVGTYQNSQMFFDNVFSSPSAAGSTKIKETIRPYNGLPSGVQVTTAGGQNISVSSWAESGHVIEFTVVSSDGGFISFSPFKTDWGLSIEDLDLVPLEGSVPEVIGIYLDFTSTSQELPYNLNAGLLSSSPIGTGKHPFENHDVVYATLTGTALSEYAFASTAGNKLRVSIDSLSQFESFSLDSIVKALGLTNNFNQFPKINLLRIGILIKGIQVDRYALLDGDYNCDFTVNAADYTVWRDNFGATDAGPCAGDGDYDGNVDGDDYVVWRSNFGNTYQPPAPPPSAIAAPPASEAPAGISGPPETASGINAAIPEDDHYVDLNSKAPHSEANPAAESGFTGSQTEDSEQLDGGKKEEKKKPKKKKKKKKNRNKEKSKRNSIKKESKTAL